MCREYLRRTAITKELAQRRAELESEGMQSWVKARERADFTMFAPNLREWVDVLKKYAQAIDPARPVYDVLLDDYEKGMTSQRLDQIFAEVRHDNCCTCILWFHKLKQVALVTEPAWRVHAVLFVDCCVAHVLQLFRGHL